MDKQEDTATTAVPQKRVSWAELYFDLVFVLAITQMTVLLHGDHSAAGLLRALLVFVPIYWAWVGTAVYANTGDMSSAQARLGTCALGLCGMFMALAVPAAFGPHGPLFGLAYFLLRLILLVLVRIGPGTVVLAPFGVAVVITGPLLLIGGFLPDPLRIGLWAVAAVLDLATPAVLASRQMSHISFDAAHLPERFGLFLIIALGESIVALAGPSGSLPQLDATVIGAVAAAFVLVCALWWLYFGFAADALPVALAAAKAPVFLVRQLLSYTHLALIASIIVFATGLEEVVAAPTEATGAPTAGLLFGGCALYVAALAYTHYRLVRRWPVLHLVTVVAELVAAVVAAAVPGLLALAVLAVLITVLGVAAHPREPLEAGLPVDGSGF